MDILYGFGFGFVVNSTSPLEELDPGEKYVWAIRPIGPLSLIPNT